MLKKFDEKLTHVTRLPPRDSGRQLGKQRSYAISFVAVGLIFALFCRSGKLNAQGLSLSDAAQPASGLSINNTNTNLKVIIQLPNGAIYQGAVGPDGKPEGQGTLTESTGTILQGEWRDGNPSKLSGTSVFADGTREVGTWNYGDSKGDGKIVWRDGRIYKGPWKFLAGFSDLPNGQGEMTWPDGRKYVGQFRDGKMNGVGKMTYPNGKVEDGSWQEDRFLGSTN
jgi:hypothetical protein